MRDQSFSALLFRASDNSAILFSLTSHGVECLPQGIPSLWVTAPTVEPANVGFAINSMFGIDPGRARLADSGPENEKAVRNLGHLLSVNLDALASESESNWEVVREAILLDEDASPYGLWSSFWDLLGRRLWQLQGEHRDGRDVQIAHQVFWDADYGAMPQVLRKHRLLPSELPGDYAMLCSLREIQYQVRGCLEDKEVFEQVVSWPSFRSQHKPGTLVSFRQVGRPLRSLMPGSLQPIVITLKEVIQSEFQDQCVSPETAEVVGNTVSRALLNGLEQGNQESKDERVDLLELLRSLKFQSQSGAWANAASLVIPELDSGGNPDEPLRATFAPDEHILANAYGKDGADFFRLCRTQLNVDIKEMADWALSMSGNDTRCQAVLNYLLHGERFRGVASLLIDGKQGTWLASLTFDSPQLAEFNIYERARVLGLLEIFQHSDQSPTPLPPVIVPPPRDPAEVLNAISDWWKQDRGNQLAKYERSVYPGGSAPKLSTTPENLKNDVSARQSWLELFILGATFTIGRTKPEQHREFLRQWRERGWLQEFANPGTSRARWIQILEEYFQDPNDRQDYFHWLRLFVSIYQFSNWLETYIELFLDMQRRGQFNLHNALTLKQDSTYQGGGIDAPSLVSTLGYGACFVIRELARQGVLTSTNVEKYCYVPQARLRRFLESLGCPGLEQDVRTESSTYIYQFLQSHIGNNATFGGDFDLPLQIAAGDDDLWSQFLGGDPPRDNGAEDQDYGD